MGHRHRIETLTEELMRERVHEILALEAIFYRHLAMVYADEVWTEKHFLSPRPGKWELSKAVFAADDKLLGFWIASVQDEEDLHTHRLGIHPDWRGVGILRALFAAVYTDGKRLGLKYISAITNVANLNSWSSSLTLGYRILSGAELEAFKVRRGRDRDRIEGNQLVSPEGHRYYAVRRDIE